MKTELERLREQIAAIERKQACCDHEWSEVVYEPEQVHPVRYETAGRGSHVWLEPIQMPWTEVKDRWSRTCKKCEKKEYTYEQEEVIIESAKRPKF